MKWRQLFRHDVFSFAVSRDGKWLRIQNSAAEMIVPLVDTDYAVTAAKHQHTPKQMIYHVEAWQELQRAPQTEEVSE